MNTDRNSLSERGRTNPSLETLTQEIEAIGISVSDMPKTEERDDK